MLKNIPLVLSVLYFLSGQLCLAQDSAHAIENGPRPEQVQAQFKAMTQNLPDEVKQGMKQFSAVMGIEIPDRPEIERLKRFPTPTDFNFAYIDKSGAIKILLPLALANNFHDGVAIVQPGDFHKEGNHWVLTAETDTPGFTKIGPYALLHTDGQIIRLHDYESPVGSFNGDALLLKNARASEPHSCITAIIDKTGRNIAAPYRTVDRDGKTIWEGHFYHAQEYSNGLFATAISSMKVPMPNLGVSLEAPCWGYADKSGAQVIPFKYFSANPFSENFAAVELGQNKTTLKTECCYIDRSGKVVITGPFSEAQKFSSGMAAVADLDGKWGFIDKEGKQCVDYLYDWVGPYSFDLAPVERHKMVGFIDKSGVEKIPFKFKLAREFSDGLAPATLDGINWGFIDTSGTFVIEPKFKNAFPFNSGLALVYAPTQMAGEFTFKASDAPLLFEKANDRFNLNEARACCKLILELAPGSATAADAQRLLDTALPQKDLNEEANKLYMSGILSARKSETAPAKEAYTKALAIEPNLFLANGALAYLAIQAGNLTEAEALLKKALAINPKYARGYWRLSEVYSSTDRVAEAAEALAKAKTLDPGDPYFNRN